MKRTSLLFALILGCLSVAAFPGQSDSECSYTTITWRRIKLSGDTMVITRPVSLFSYYNYDIATVEMDTIAECRIEWINNNLIRAFSKDLPLLIFRNMQLEYSEPEDTAFVTVRFVLPNLREKIKLNVIYFKKENIDFETRSFSDANETIIMDMDNRSCNLKLPKDTYSLSYYIQLCDPEMSDDTGAYYGLLEFPSIHGLVKPIPIQSKNLKITMPNINSKTLSRWFFWGDYIYITESKIELGIDTFYNDKYIDDLKSGVGR